MKKTNKKCSSKKSISSSIEEISKPSIEILEFETSVSNTEVQNLPNPQDVQSNKPKDSRIPPIGSIITKTYHGQILEVKVLENGFEYQGKTYKSISRVAMEIVKRSISGYVFFRLTK